MNKFKIGDKVIVINYGMYTISTDSNFKYIHGTWIPSIKNPKAKVVGIYQDLCLIHYINEIGIPMQLAFRTNNIKLLNGEVRKVVKKSIIYTEDF